MLDWLSSDLASWLAVAIALGAAVLAWRLLRPISYVEFHRDWHIEIKEKLVTVNGRISSVTPSAYVSGTGSLKFNKNKIDLNLKSAENHLLLQNTKVLVFEGEYVGYALTGSFMGVMKLKVRLSDGTTKRLKTLVQVKA
jgi:hypothetical protein